MADWYGAARSNYVRVTDLEALKKSLGDFDITIVEQADGRVALLSSDEYGGWPSSCYGEDGDEIEFSFEEHVVPFLRDGEILITMDSGAENLRYVTGSAQAYNRDGLVCTVDIEDIYELAAGKLGINKSAIPPCRY